MPRSLINLIGAIVTVAVLALGVFLVAVPIGLQALAVVGQTATVASTNALYQSQVDQLTAEKKRLGEIQTSVAELEGQITRANELDDVFELVAKAAEASGVEIKGVTAGDAAAFVVRTAPTTIEEAAQAADPSAAADGAEAGTPSAATSTPAPSPTDQTGQEPSTPTADAPPAPAGRTQVDFSVNVTAPTFDQAIAFLDALRNGPRLLEQVETSIAPTGTGFDVTLSALTFVLPKGGE